MDSSPREKEPIDQSPPKTPAGGFDDTPIPFAPPGFTLKFTIHRATNLPLGDFSTLSSDPYVIALLSSDLPRRHKQDPGLSCRTHTVRKDINPQWNTEWTVANVPASGFLLKCRVYDEDSADHDDRLGTAYVDVKRITEDWAGFKEEPFRVKKKAGSQRAYLLTSIAAICSKNVSSRGLIYLSIECLGRTPGNEGGRMYTIGPNSWSRHFSPLIGRLAGTKESVQTEAGKRPITRYNFQAVQIQLAGPVPAALYHRYVEFRPFVAGMFNSQSLRGRFLNHALHHQHARIYTFDRATVFGSFPSPSVDLTKQFLEFVHYDQGGRIFTYVLTLDAQWRFTETGKEFGIDLLSKHTMHSDVSIYIAYSGEFFVRRKRHHRRHRHHNSGSSRPETANTDDDAVIDFTNATSAEESVHPITTDPEHYELVIDNDSGTYRPNSKLLPQLQSFLSTNLPGLQITTLASQEDAELMARLKQEQRDRKRAEGGTVTYLQRRSSSFSSLSSSDEEDLDARENEQPPKQRGHFSQRVHGMMDPKARFKEWVETGHISPAAGTNKEEVIWEQPEKKAPGRGQTAGPQKSATAPAAAA